MYALDLVLNTVLTNDYSYLYKILVIDCVKYILYYKLLDKIRAASLKLFNDEIREHAF